MKRGCQGFFERIDFENWSSKDLPSIEMGTDNRHTETGGLFFRTLRVIKRRENLKATNRRMNNFSYCYSFKDQICMHKYSSKMCIYRMSGKWRIKVNIVVVLFL